MAIPPEQILLHFLHNLTITTEDELFVPVLRGSLLMRRWFGKQARPAADIDLECFQREPTEAPEHEYNYEGSGNFGLHNEFHTIIDFAKAMCRYAAQHCIVVQFLPNADSAEDNTSLWVYGTPGERYQTLWSWSDERLTGTMHIDLASPGSYTFDTLGTVSITFSSPFEVLPIRGEPPPSPTFSIACYSQEMMLAAKLSWLLRSLEHQQPQHGQPKPPRWIGEPKDLFDTHLLLTQGTLDAHTFQTCMNLVLIDDAIHWSSLEALLNIHQTPMKPAAFANWPPFEAQHTNLLNDNDPWTMLCTIAQALQPLLGDFQIAPNEATWFETIHNNSEEEAHYLAFAKWLTTDNAPLKAEILCLLVHLKFHTTPGTAGHDEARTTLIQSLRHLRPWFNRIFLSSSACQNLLNERQTPSGPRFSNRQEALDWGMTQNVFRHEEHAARTYDWITSYASHNKAQADACWIAEVERIQAERDS